MDSLLKIYLATWIIVFMASIAIFLNNPKNFSISTSHYWKFLLKPWKTVTFIIAATGITIVAATAYELCVAIDFDTREPHYYINGRHVHTGGPLTSLATLLWVIGVQTTASAAKELDIRNLLLSQRYSADP